MNEILLFLKKHGERADNEIAEAAGIPLTKARLYLSELAANGKIMMCSSVLFEKGKKVEQMICRISGYIPPAALGRKSKAQKQQSTDF